MFSMPGLEPRISVDTSLTPASQGSASALHDDAANLVREYTSWYGEFVTQYAIDLRANGEEDPEGLQYAEGAGVVTLLYLAQRVRVQVPNDLKKLQRVFRGFRSLASRVTDLWGRAELVITLVEKIEVQLRRLELLADDQLAASHTDHRVTESARASVEPISVQQVRVNLPRQMGHSFASGTLAA